MTRTLFPINWLVAIACNVWLVHYLVIDTSLSVEILAFLCTSEHMAGHNSAELVHGGEIHMYMYMYMQNSVPTSQQAYCRVVANNPWLINYLTNSSYTVYSTFSEMLDPTVPACFRASCFSWKRLFIGLVYICMISVNHISLKGRHRSCAK